MLDTGERVMFDGTWCDVRLGTYPNGNTVLLLEDFQSGEAVCKATVNPGFQTNMHEVVIKNDQENHGVLDALTSAGVVDIPHLGVNMRRNYTVYICRLNENIINLMEDILHERSAARS